MKNWVKFAGMCACVCVCVISYIQLRTENIYVQTPACFLAHSVFIDALIFNYARRLSHAEVGPWLILIATFGRPLARNPDHCGLPLPPRGFQDLTEATRKLIVCIAQVYSSEQTQDRSSVLVEMKRHVDISERFVWSLHQRTEDQHGSNRRHMYNWWIGWEITAERYGEAQRGDCCISDSVLQCITYIFAFLCLAMLESKVTKEEFSQQSSRGCGQSIVSSWYLKCF